jgi:hypothetical protein
MPASPQIIIEVEGESSSTPGAPRVFPYSKISLSSPLIRVSLLNNTGITSYYWEFVHIPSGSIAVFNDPSLASPEFYATQGRPGPYLIRCSINSDQSIGTNGLAFLTENYGLRKFAYLETMEFGSVGWTDALNAIIDAIESGSGGGGGSDPNSIQRDGSRVFIGNQPLGGNKLTGLGAATVNGDAVRYEQWNDHETRIVGLEAGSGTSYTNATPMPEDVGGWEAGSTFLSVPFEDLITGLLYPYQYPAFSAFSYSGITNPLEVGAGTTVNPTFTWTTLNPTNVSPNTIDIISAGTPVVTGLADDGSQTVTLPAVVKTSATTHTFSIEGTDTHSSVFSRNLVINWYWKRYSGTSALVGPLTESQIEALTTSALASGFAGTYSFSSGNYKYICYAAVLGTATSFVDVATGFAVAMEPVYTVSVTNAFGQTTNYNVHRTTNTIASAINIAVS